MVRSEDHDTSQTAGRGIFAPRVHSPGPEAGEAAASLHNATPARQDALLCLREQLIAYVREHRIGHEFQAVDFNHWLDQQGDDRPDEGVLDRRACGGLFVALANAGILERRGYRNNGGNADRNYHGAPRVVYVIASHDTTTLGWIEQRDHHD